MVLLEQRKYDVLDDWFKTEQGRHVADAFSLQLQFVSKYIVGNKILQLGAFGEINWLSRLKFNDKMLVSPSLNAKNATFFATINNLPLDRNSIDCILAPLTIEIFSKAVNPLDEMDRVLKSQGLIIFFGINPYSFWGGAVFFQRLTCFINDSIKLQSSLSLKRALLSRGYRQYFLSNFYYIPPVKNQWLIHKMKFLNEVGKMVCPYPASFYCLIMQKYESGSSLVGDKLENLSLAKVVF